MRKLLIGLSLLSSTTVLGMSSEACKQVSENVSSCKYETNRVLFELGKCKTNGAASNQYYHSSIGYYSKGEIVLTKEWLEINAEVDGEIENKVRK